jgi:hypothetical protein
MKNVSPLKGDESWGEVDPFTGEKIKKQDVQVDDSQNVNMHY